MTTEIETRGALHISDAVSDVLNSLENSLDLIKKDGAEGEKLGRPTDAVQQALRDSGVFKLCAPAVLGGFEASPLQVIEVIEKIAYADASTAWATMAVMIETGSALAYLGDQAAEELTANAAFPVCAGQGTFPGQAKKADGGYRISGHWRFASGMPMASHIHTAALVEETDEVRLFVVPKDKAQLIDNWDVMGLRATGSIDYVLEDVFVPEAYSHVITTKQPLRGGSFYRMGLANIAGVVHGGWAIGVARRLLDEMTILAEQRSRNRRAPVNTDEFYAEAARAETKLRSAHAFLLETWRSNEEILQRDEPLDHLQETLNRSALANAKSAALDISHFVFKWAGVAALRSGDVQRFFRDVHAGTQHASANPVVTQDAGRVFSGRAPESEWVFFDLVQAEQ